MKVLLAERLLNEQPRPDTKAYELAHDSLVRPLMSMRRGRILRQVASVLAVTFVGLGAWQSWRYYRLQQAVNLARQNVDVQRRLAENRNASPEERRVALINIYNAGRNGLLGRRFGTLVLPGIDGSDVHLHGAILDSARLDSAVLNRTILDSASLVAVRLGGASLRLASLEEANLTRASLDGVVADSASFARATLVGASLRGASLVGAKFTNADLSNARFTDADLRFADVRWGVKIDGIDLTGTAWWHARGWSDAQVESLRGRFAPAAFTSSSQYRRFRASLNDGVDSAIALRRNTRSALNASPGEQAVLVDTVAAVLMSAYHRRARFEALFGTHFDSAYSDVEKVLVQPEYARDPNLLDTRAYILLRWSWDDARPNPRRGDARRDLLRALRQDVSAIRPEMGERFYHLGLVYEALKDSVPARVAFQNAATAGYDPTYERALTPSRWAASAYGQRWPYDR